VSDAFRLRVSANLIPLPALSPGYRLASSIDAGLIGDASLAGDTRPVLAVRVDSPRGIRGRRFYCGGVGWHGAAMRRCCKAVPT